MSIPYSVVPGLSLLGLATAAGLLFPQGAQSVAYWLVHCGALFIQL